MSDKDRSGPAEGAKGVVEDVKGRFKEALGAVTGNDSKVREGQAQQDKAAAQREVAEKEAAAERARTEADVHEARERSHQDR
ncbi:CsbD family protein [Actinophytocola sp.]|uniref:microaggregate-binding protein 1 n=1 Tax=Actinophytocola sp. TaxID=1872138 RepID=UPI002D3A4083|nr:CsbD family protein [Actinophytocola sp.]HYQ62627.1 CsbD family protein [Actinophytocola sp.]